MSNLLHQFSCYWHKQFPSIHVNGCHIVVAASGGIDSMVLANLLEEGGFSFSLAHANFGLRGKESDADEAFVAAWAGEHQVAFYSRCFNTQEYAEIHHVSTQVAARNLRYEWFEELLASLQLKHEHINKSFWLATAHHSDDNVETVLMNIFRGTGINGLHGILPLNGKVLRPLLFASREQIVEYAQQKKVEWREDATNATDKYSRNFFRRQVIPLVQEVYPEVKTNILDSVERWKEVEVIYENALQKNLQKLLVNKNNEVYIPCAKLMKQPGFRTMLFEITKAYQFSAAQQQDILQLLQSDSGKWVASSTHRIIRNRRWLIITPVAFNDSSNILIQQKDRSVLYSAGRLHIEPADVRAINLNTRDNVVFIDADELVFPLLLRPWKQGDYFYPLGLNKKKKLSRFFVDMKLSVPDKEKVWVLESKGKIVWVTGHRLDHRYRITVKTKNALKIELRVH